MPASRPPLVGVGWDAAMGWYAWFGQPPYTVRVPFKTVASPLKAAGRTMAANPIVISGAVIVGLLGALVGEKRARSRAEEAQAYESTRAGIAESDRDVARSQVEDMEKQLERGHEMTLDISEGVTSEIRRQLGINDYDRNIAVCGRVSTGKSAFVNAVRGLLPTSVGAAPIGNEETTTEITPYRDPHLPAVVWWDIPGAAGQNSREWSYCSQQCLFAFDQVILTERNIYRSCIENGKEVLIVRTQSDNNMSRIRDANPSLQDIFLVDRCISDSVRATESFLESLHLPRPLALYHVTARLLTQARDPSHILAADPLLHRIGERVLLTELGIPPVEGRNDGDFIADHLEEPAAPSDGETDEAELLT